MININTYNTKFENFSNIDLNKNWVSLEKCKVMVDQFTLNDVWIPQVKSKRNIVIRWICKIINYIRGKNPQLELANQLVNATKTFNSIKDQNLSDLTLQKKIVEITLQLLHKFEKKHLPNHPYLITTIENEKIKITLQEQTNKKNLPEDPIPTKNLPKIKPLSTEYTNYKLGEKSLEVAFSVDWDKDNSLFHPSFVNSWISGFVKSWIPSPLFPYFKSNCWSYQDKSIPLSNEIIHTHEDFIEFLQELMNPNPHHVIKDHYGFPLTSENIKRLRQMLCAIMNTIYPKDYDQNNLEQMVDFQDKYKRTVSETYNALQNCSNAMNTAIENLFYEIVSPSCFSKTGAIGQKVEFRLQKLRDGIFRKIIQDFLDHEITMIYQPKNGQYTSYAEHGAATFNYYYGMNELCKKLGLPLSISALDSRYKGYALKDKEMAILEKFNQEYTPSRIIDVIYDAICDIYDITIPTAFFTEWVQKQNMDQETILDENGQYQKETVIKLLEELEIIKSKT